MLLESQNGIFRVYFIQVENKMVYFILIIFVIFQQTYIRYDAMCRGALGGSPNTEIVWITWLQARFV